MLKTKLGHVSLVIALLASSVLLSVLFISASDTTSQATMTVHNYSQLHRALEKHASKRTIIVKGTIDPLKNDSKANLAKGTGYSFKRYLLDYNPKSYRMKKPKGAQEKARVKAERNEEQRIKLNVPDHTIIRGKGGRIQNAELNVEGKDDTVEGLRIQAPVDYFPQWDGTDGSSGNWNSQFDAISVRGGTNDNIRDNVLTDGAYPDNVHRNYYGRNYQQHDGLCDITNGANDINVENNTFQNHDKTMLIGNSDSRISDMGKLYVTIKGNTFTNDVQRLPRVRFGHVRVLDNMYHTGTRKPYKFLYAWGAGKDSHIYADGNRFTGDVNPDRIISVKGSGQHVTAKNTTINGKQVDPTKSKDFKPAQKMSLYDRVQLFWSRVKNVWAHCI